MMAKERKHKPVLNKEIFDRLNDDLGIEEEKPTELNLNIIAESYHKNFNNEKAIQWFNNHGIKKLNRLIELKILAGFSDGSLIGKLSERQIDELLKINVLNQNEEQFLNCITIPVVDEADQVVNIYGININDDKVKNLNESGLFNQKACKVYDEVILTESVIDALSFIELDFNNVISIEGADNFKSEYIKVLKDNRVKTVIIAFKNSVSSTFASDKIKNMLLEEGINVKIINQISCDDWNKELLEGITREDVLNIIGTADTFKPEKSNDFDVKKDGLVYSFSINDVTYRISGVKEMFVSNLKVNIKAELRCFDKLSTSNEKYFDNLDLYSARSRSSYSQNLANIFNIESKRIEKDLIKILEYLEEERDKKLKGNDKNEKEELTEEEKRMGLEFLKSPDIFQQIIDDMTTLGYVGEDLNKVLLYLAASSRILDDPISVMIISQSAAGKSMLIETLRKMLPPEDVIALTSLSDQALNYIGDILHKFMIMGEAVHNEQVEHQIRDMLSNHELSRLVPVKDEKTGKHKSEQFITKAIVSMAIGGTTLILRMHQGFL